jgi:mannonate dehydratase
MKITEVKVFLTCPGRNYVFVKVMTDEPGIYGVGEGTLNGSEPIVAKAIEHLSNLIIGRDPAQIEDIWNTLYYSGYWRGGPIFAAALAAIDFALWDIKGKVAGMPVYQLLGGRSREGAPVYGHAHGADPKAVEDSARAFIEKGFKFVRCQLTGGYGGYGGGGLLRHEDSNIPGHNGTDYFAFEPYLIATPKLFEHLRVALGMEINLLHDVHEQLMPIEAAQLAKNLEPYRLFFLEDALRPEQKEHYPLLRQASTTPLAIGEIITSRWDCLPLFQNHWIDFIRTAPIHVGGITEIRRICVLADTYFVRTAFHGALDLGPIGQAAAVQVDLSIPNFGVQEWMDFPERVHEVVSGICYLKDGMAYVNEQPGLGVDLNEEEAKKYPYQQAYMPTHRRMDGTIHPY